MVFTARAAFKNQVWFDFDAAAFGEMDVPTAPRLPTAKAAESSVPKLWENDDLEQPEDGTSNDDAKGFTANEDATGLTANDDAIGCTANEDANGFTANGDSLGNYERQAGEDAYGSGRLDDQSLQRALVGGGSQGGDTCLEDAYARYIGELEHEAAATASMETAISQRQAAVYGESDRRRSQHQHEVKELQRFIKDQMAAKAAERDAAAARARALAAETSLQSSAAILTRDAGVAEVLGAPKPLPEVDTSQMSPRAVMVHRMRTKITDGGIRGKGQGPLSRNQLLASLQGQIGAKESLGRSRKEYELEEERRYLEHVKAEMHLHATHARAAELGKQRDLLAAWERDGHLKNLNKLKSLGPSAMRDYARDVLTDAPATSAAAAAPGSSSARLSRGADSTRMGMASRSSARASLSVGFDPRST